jgi:hypothetical protein
MLNVLMFGEDGSGSGKWCANMFRTKCGVSLQGEYGKVGKVQKVLTRNINGGLKTELNREGAK